MSVTLLAPVEIASIIGSFARYAGQPTDAAQLDMLADVFATANAAAYAVRYRSECAPVRVTRAQIAAARLNPLSPSALVEAIKHYEYQACELPEWESSPVARAVAMMLDYCQRGTAPALVSARADEAREREEARMAKIRAEEGARYQETRDESTAQIAARVRADIKAAVKAGALPEAKYSVKSRRFSGGSAIDITVDALPFCAWELVEDNRGTYCGRMEWQVRATAEAARVRDAVEAIRTSYGYDHSDIQTDYFCVRYYGNTTIADDEERRALSEHAAEVNRGALDRAEEAVR